MLNNYLESNRGDDKTNTHTILNYYAEPVPSFTSSFQSIIIIRKTETSKTRICSKFGVVNKLNNYLLPKWFHLHLYDSLLLLTLGDKPWQGFIKQDIIQAVLRMRFQEFWIVVDERFDQRLLYIYLECNNYIVGTYYIAVIIVSYIN